MITNNEIASSELFKSGDQYVLILLVFVKQKDFLRLQTSLTCFSRAIAKSELCNCPLNTF
jgi:hypothetical protein